MSKAFYIGPMIEHTPAYSKKTLFVVGKRDLNRILELSQAHKTSHIFMGADRSFGVGDDIDYWESTITELLDRGYWVTLEYQAHEHQAVLEMLNAGIWQSRLFIPLLSIHVPEIQTSSHNLTVKIDDSSNPGVWCLNHHEITDSNRFTDWNEYGDDIIIQEDNKPTPIPRKTTIIDVGDVTPDKISAVIKEVSLDINETDLGLAPDEKSLLKPDPDEVVTKFVLPTPEDTAEAYAQGAKEDPLGKEGSKKKAKK